MNDPKSHPTNAAEVQVNQVIDSLQTLKQRLTTLLNAFQSIKQELHGNQPSQKMGSFAGEW